MSTSALSGFSGSNMMTLLFPILLIVIFVVLIIVPNKRKEKKFKEMVEALRVGDRIKTIGGFYGKISAIKEDLVTMECGPDKTKLVIAKGAIASVERDDDAKEPPKKEEPEKVEAAKDEAPKAKDAAKKKN
ncbi:MAG: preprotein translocase subunit YajC [Christensenella sp.]|nr:preprotein translocase subunit YajC [Christensenella sp.]